MLLLASCSQYKYETVKGDPLGTKIYTLDNGLKVYMTVNEEKPRIQTYIAVRVGAKNDPAETTGLAHYFEHLMFKGTDKFGTQSYEAEKPLLNEIERLFEVYRATTDEAERKFIEHEMELLAKKNAPKGEKKLTPTQEANEGIKSAIYDYLKEKGKPMTITQMIKEIPECAGLTNQKVSALVRQMVDAFIIARKVDKGVAWFSIA